MLTRTALTLALAAPLAAADDPVDGFQVESLPDPVVVSDEVLTLSSGEFLASNGAVVRLLFPGGAQKAQLAVFSPTGTAGALAVDPSERYVLAGEATVGSLLWIDRQTGEVKQVGELPGNEDAVFLDPTTVVVSSTACSGQCGNSLVLIDTATNEVKTLATIDDVEAGSLALQDDGSLLFTTRDSQTGAGEVRRFDASELTVGPPVFHEQGGFLAVEIESMPAFDLWVEETEDVGFTGTSYYRWNGPNYFNTPGISPINYQIVIENPGRYEFVIHNKHDFPESDKENDVWVQMDNGPWNKVFSNGGSSFVGVWNWLSWFDYTGPMPNEQAFYDLTAGPHTLRIAARSFNFKIDRFHLYQLGLPDVLDVDEPEASRGLELSDSDVVLGNTQDATDLTVGSDGVIYVADRASGGRGRVRAKVPGVPGAEVLLRTDVVETIDDLDWIDGTGVGLFAPYQPETAGELTYQTLLGGSTYARGALRPARPTLDLRGSALTGPGTLLVELAGAEPGSIGFLFADAGPFGGELQVPGFPLVWTPLSPASALLLPGSVPVDPSGEGAISYPSTGLAGVDLGLQAILFSPTEFDFTASTAVAEL